MFCIETIAPQRFRAAVGGRVSVRGCPATLRFDALTFVVEQCSIRQSDSAGEPEADVSGRLDIVVAGFNRAPPLLFTPTVSTMDRLRTHACSVVSEDAADNAGSGGSLCGRTHCELPSALVAPTTSLSSRVSLGVSHVDFQGPSELPLAVMQRTTTYILCRFRDGLQSLGACDRACVAPVDRGCRWDGEGHVAGCGLDFDRGAIYFTRDGVLVGTKPCEFACRARSGSEQLPKLFPAIGLYGDGATVKVNFGQNPFVYHVANLPSIGARLLQPPGPSYNSNGVAGVTPPAPLVPAWPFVAGADAAPPGPRSLVLPPSADAAADFFAQVLFVCVWRIGDK
eukprot:TRINITY_DN6226_c0_g1_i3.p1 TRINITY_DN6226_c0_g1~~TRINITY_DN6226_c0_g1_i3.p1  ORF type:complete len:339 (-),score=11.61 TRINITY_DN6226_c0_g1_i3:61-1077(-)